MNSMTVSSGNDDVGAETDPGTVAGVGDDDSLPPLPPLEEA